MSWDKFGANNRNVDDFGRDYIPPSGQGNWGNDLNARTSKRRSQSPDLDRGRDSVVRDSRRTERRRSFSPEDRGYRRQRDYDNRGRDNEGVREDSRRFRGPVGHGDVERGPDFAPFGYRQDGKPYDFWEFAFSWDDFLSMRAFAEQYRAAHPNLQTRNEDSDKLVSAEYAKYRQQFNENQCRKFFNDHKDEEWFEELYHPILGEQFKQSLVPRKQQVLARFMADLDSGCLDTLSYDETSRPPRKGRPVAVAESSTAESDKPAKDGGETESKGNVEELTAELEDNAEPADSTARAERILHVSYVPVEIKRQALEEVFKTLPGYKYTSFSLPNASKQFSRQVWVSLSPEVEPDEVLKLLDGKTLNYKKRGGGTAEYTLKAQVNSGFSSYGRDGPEDAESLERLEFVLQKCQQVLTRFFEIFTSEKVEDVFEGLTRRVADSDELVTKKRLVDLHVELLRRVFWFDIYTGMSCTSYEEFQRKCTPFYRKLASLRKEDAAAPSQKRTRYGRERDPKEEAARFWTRMEERLNLVLNPPKLSSSVDSETLEEPVQASNQLVLKFGAVYVDVALKKRLEELKLLEQRDDQKFRCGFEGCGKMFKAADFLIKHMHNKHSEILPPLEVEINFQNNYAVDPFKITWYNQLIALRERDPSVGHFYSDYLAIARASRHANQVTPQMNARLVGMVGTPNFQSMMQFNPLMAAAAMMNLSGGAMIGGPNRLYGGNMNGGFRGRGNFNPYSNRGRGFGMMRGGRGGMNGGFRRNKTYVDVDEQVSGGGEDLLLSYD